jgi:hypothetical protein
MAVRVENSIVHTDFSFEKELVLLCRQYPKLYVVCMHQLRAGSAMVRFYANLPLAMRKQLPMSSTRWEIVFDNGSIIRFLAFNDNEHLPIPEPPVHAFVNYGIVNSNALSNMSQVAEPYSGKLATGHDGLFPLLFDGEFISVGDEFIADMKKIKRKLENDNRMHTVVMKKEPDVTKYPKAQEVLDEEAKVMCVFKDSLIETRKMDLATKKGMHDLTKHNGS